MPQESPSLVRALGVWEAAAVVVGTVIGTGIFLKPRAIAELLDSPGLILGIWVAGGLLSLLGALSYAELGTMFPAAGGEYVFMREAYGRFGGFLWAWTYFVCAKIGSIAALGAGFVTYLSAFVPLSRVGQAVAAMVAILSITAINHVGVAAGGRLQAFLTVLKMASLAGIMALAFASPTGSFEHLQPMAPTARPGLFGAMGLALVAVLWAYDGWNDLVMVAGEIRDPDRNIVRSLVWGMAAIMALYVTVNVAYHYALPVGIMAHTPRVAAAAVEGVLGARGAAVVSGVILVSILGALNGSILSGARIPYAAAVDGVFPKGLARVHATYFTPVTSLWAQGLLASAFLAIPMGKSQFDALTDMVIFAEWAFYGMCCAAVILLRRTRPDQPRPYRAWGYPWAQVVFVIAAVAIFINSIVEAPRPSLTGLGLILLGAPLYLFVRGRRAE